MNLLRIAVFDSTRLLFDLQQVNQLGQSLAGCLDPTDITRRITEALVQQFDCAFARIWLTDPDQKALTLVASSGLYTHINGSFSHVPMGSYKVGKIAQNHVPFLSNHLPDESWVKDREWAISNRIQGFAGYPLMAQDRVLGVLAAFSCEPLASEFLEVLQILCLTTTIALDAAIQYQRHRLTAATESFPFPSLSDQVAQTLTTSPFYLIGTERTISPSLGYLVLRTVELLEIMETHYCRLLYGRDSLSLEAILAMTKTSVPFLSEEFVWMQQLAENWGGSLITRSSKQNRELEIYLELPYIQRFLERSIESAILSEREQQIIGLLAQGHRDRDIAQQLHISESTVKFHINNTVTKLSAKNRYHAVYEATNRSLI